MARAAVAAVLAAVGCARGDAAGTASASVAGQGATGWAAEKKAGVALGAGLYVVRSAARHRGDSLRLIDRTGSTQYGGQLVAAGPRGGLFEGTVTVEEGGRVNVQLVCALCPVGRDADGRPTYDVVTYAGVFATRAVGGHRVELRQTDGPAVDTLERVR